jgi:hypothetical protein
VVGGEYTDGRMEREGGQDEVVDDVDEMRETTTKRLRGILGHGHGRRVLSCSAFQPWLP